MSNSRPNLRIAMPDSPAPMDMADAITAMARQCVASQPVAVLMVYENTDGKLVRLAIPPSLSFTQGVIDRLYIELHPELFAD